MTTQPVVTVPPVGLRIIDADDSGALLLADGELRAVDDTGRTRWHQPMPRAGVQCLTCPTALETGGRTRPQNASTPPAGATSQDLVGALALGQAWIRPEQDALQVLVPTATTTIELGRVPATSLDPSAYAFAPSVAVADDGRSGAAVVGRPDPLEPGRAQGWYLRVGQAPRSVDVGLANPNAGGLSTLAGDRPLGLGRDLPRRRALARVGAVRGGRRPGPRPVRIALPVSSCAVTPQGSCPHLHLDRPPGHVVPGAVWVDTGGRVVRTARARNEAVRDEPRSQEAAGRVLLPVVGGGRLHDARPGPRTGPSRRAPPPARRAALARPGPTGTRGSRTVTTLELHAVRGSLGRRPVGPYTFQVHEGETVALVGANGSGKTTGLHYALGLRRATTGRVVVHGEPVGPSRPPFDVGAALLDDGLDPDLTARSDLALLAPLRRAEPGIDEVLGVVGLAHTAARPPGRSQPGWFAASAWPGRCSADPPCWCSTSPPPRSTTRPGPGWPRSSTSSTTMA